MAVKLKEIREGSTVMVRGSFGRDPAVIGKVDEVSSDIKNGRAGIGYMVGNDSFWAYLDAVEKVITF